LESDRDWSSYGDSRGKRLDGITGVFLFTTVLRSVTGFALPFDHLLPSHKVGIISLVAPALAIPARYARHLAGPWRWIHVVSTQIVLYLNVFVVIAQLFKKVPTLKALAPKQTEPPFG
jgi:hypothetical protein